MKQILSKIRFIPAACLLWMLVSELLGLWVGGSATISALLSEGTSAPVGQLLLASLFVVFRLTAILIAAPLLATWAILWVLRFGRNRWNDSRSGSVATTRS